MLPFCNPMLRTFIFLATVLYCSPKRTINIERLFKDVNFAKFLVAEFNYTDFLSRAPVLSGKFVPFQDTSNDTYFRVGMLHKSQLENYTKIKMEEHLGLLKNKPWLPVHNIREEFAKCLSVKYGSLSENDFKYDKGLYGWMNIMKFSCAAINENFFVFAMAFTRTRFRLKQVFLRRQNTYWATSGRSIITRDVQKIAEHFFIGFSLFVNEKLREELKRHSSENLSEISFSDSRENYLKLTSASLEEFSAAYNTPRSHTPLDKSRVHTFNTLAVESNDTYNAKTETHNYLRENAFVHKVTSKLTLLAFQTSKPYFQFETMKRKTSHGIVDHKQHLNDDARQLWTHLLEQQFALAMRFHYRPFFPHDSIVYQNNTAQASDSSGEEQRR